MLHELLTKDIIGAAMAVLNELRPGLDEKLYENALVLELQSHGHVIDQQRQFPVFYKNTNIGTLIPDMIVDNLVIVDPKVVTAFNENHLAQILGYLSITDLEVGMLLNFKFAKLHWKRIIRTRERTTDYTENADNHNDII